MFKTVVLLITSLVIIICFPTSSSSEEIIDSLLGRADSFYNVQAFDSAIATAYVALQYLDDNPQPIDSTRLLVLNRLALFHYDLGNLNLADSLYRDILVRQSEFCGPFHREITLTLNNLGRLNYDLGEYDRAEDYLRQSLGLWEAMGVTHDLWLAQTFNYLANIHADKGEFMAAESLYVKALDMRHGLLGEQHEDIAQSLNNIALIYHEQGRFDEAEILYKKALDIWESVLGPDHPEIVSGINNLAYLYSDAGRFDLAGPLYLRALKIREMKLGRNHPATALSANNLALHYMDIGRLEMALPLYQQVRQVWEKTLGPNHPKVATVLNNIANLYMNYENVSDALPLFELALKIRIEALGANHPDVGNIIHNMAGAHDLYGNYVIAESLYTEELKIRQQALGRHHEKVAMGLNSLAVVQYKQKKYDEAEAHLTEAMSIYSNTFGDDHPGVAFAVLNLAEIYRLRGLIDSALALHERAIAMLRASFGDIHQEVAVAKEAYAHCLHLSGQNERALSYAAEAFDTRLTNLHQSLPILSEPDALTYSNIMRRSASKYLTFYFSSQDRSKQSSHEAAVVLLNTKGCVTDAMLNRGQVLQTENNSRLNVINDSLTQARSRLASLYVERLWEDEHFDESAMSQITEIIDHLESKLAIESHDHGQIRYGLRVTPEQIAEQLPQGTALVDLFKYGFTLIKPEEKIVERYAALCINSNGVFEVVDVAEARQVDQLSQTLRMCLNKMASNWPFIDSLVFATVDSLSRALYGMVWLPLKGAMGMPERLYLSPDGELNLLSFAALQDDSSYLVEHYPIYYLNAGRDLLHPKNIEDHNHPKIRLAMGDPDFMAPSSTRSNAMNLPDDLWWTKDTAHVKYTLRSFRTSFSNPFTTPLDRLPYTKREVEQVADIWRSENNNPVVVCLGSAASEEMLKVIAGGCERLHLATHGFFYMIPVDTLSDKASQWNPLLYSGLFLAGAGVRDILDTTSESEDGVVTAQEVSELNLRNCESVVLSACHSGAGEVISGEGVYGLKRAFQMAGANLVVSSLWAIPDKETASLMGRIYSEKRQVSDILRDMAITQIQLARAAGEPTFPFTTAAFIATGGL